VQPQQNLVGAVCRFSRVLKKAGFRATAARTQDVLRALPLIDVGDRRQFFVLLRAALANDYYEFQHFSALFEQFWGPCDREQEGPGDTRPGEDGKGGQAPFLVRAGERRDQTGENRITSSSLEEGLRFKDVSEMNAAELGLLEPYIMRLAQRQRLSRRLSRRRQKLKKGSEIDLRSTMHQARKNGGEQVELRFLDRQHKPKPLYLLLDVSGSMDIFGHFFLLFMWAVQKYFRQAGCFLFSTHLTPISQYLKNLPLMEAYEQAQQNRINWSGGTDIGTSLMDFYSHHFRLRSLSSPLVVIVSDGWDRGNPKTLKQAMALIGQGAGDIFWLNPLLASPDYEPICQGMSTALPYVDHFMPLYNLDTLERVCRGLAGERLVAYPKNNYQKKRG